jgi:hypothetical protein
LEAYSVKFTEYLFSKGINSFKQKKFNYSTISTDESKNKIAKYETMVDDLMKHLEDQKYKKKEILPGVTLEE